MLVVAGTACVGASLLWHPFAFWAASNTALLGVVRLGADGARHRLGLPVRRRLADRAAAHADRCSTAARSSASTACCASRSPGRCSSAPTSSACSATSSSRCSATATPRAPRDGRYNVLLLGGDAGAGRWGLRPDSLTVASIDAETGKTVLISLPRNMANFPFREGSVMDEQFPDGFDCDGCYLNGVSTWAGDHTELFQHDRPPGRRRHRDGGRGHHRPRRSTTGRWSTSRASRTSSTPFGGVTLNVRDRDPGRACRPTSTSATSSPASSKLDGLETLWFARARYGSDDYSRMARQKCVMNAMLQQVSPQAALRNFADDRPGQLRDGLDRRSRAARSTGSSSSPCKAKDQKISTLSLVPPMINTARPRHRR